MNEYLHLYKRGIGSPEQNKVFRPTVIKIGGSTVVERENTVKDIAFLYHSGIPVLIVHGGGIEIDQALEKRNIAPKKIGGERVTDALTLETVISVLDGINAQIVEQLSALNVPAKGYNSSSKLLQGFIENSALGFVGEITKVEKDMLNKKIVEKVVPIISPIAVTQDSLQLLNVNADIVAGEIASSFGFNLVLLTNVAGVFSINGNLDSELSYEDYRKLQQAGGITKGMKPKLKASFAVATFGEVFIGRSSELKQVFLGKPKGTFIKVLS